MLCKKFWKIYVNHFIICRRTICDRKRWSACSKCPKNGCWDVHLSCKVCQQLHIFKEYIRRVNLKYNCCGRVPQTGELEERDIRLDVQVGQAIQDGWIQDVWNKYNFSFIWQANIRWSSNAVYRFENGNGNISTKDVEKMFEMEKENVETLRMCRSRQAGFCSHQTSEALRWRRYRVDVHKCRIFCDPPPLFPLGRKWGEISPKKGLNVVFLH